MKFSNNMTSEDVKYLTETGTLDKFGNQGDLFVDKNDTDYLIQFNCKIAIPTKESAGDFSLDLEDSL